MTAADPEKAAQEPIPQVQDQTADIGPEPQQKKKSSTSKLLNFGSLVLYFQLLVSASPTWIDIILLVAGALAAAAAGTPFPLMGILFGELVDDVNSATCEASEKGTSDSYASAIQSKVLQLVYVSIAAFILIYAYVSSWSLVSQRLAHRLREMYFKSLLRQDISFFDDRHAGEVSARLNGDIQAIQSGTGEKVGIFIASISFFVTAYIIAFIKQPDLAGILVSLVPAFLLMSLVGGSFVQKFAGIASDAIAAGSSIASEALSNVAVVQTFGMGRRLETKFAADMLVARKAGIKKAIASATQAGLLFFIAYSANALAFWQGSRKIAAAAEGDGDASIGRIYTVVFLLVDACVILGSVAPLLPLFGGASSAFERLKKDIDTLSRIDGTSEEGQRLQSDVSGGVDFRGVSFSYPSRPNHPVLRQVDLHFSAGKYTAIVGLSGSGKSTVASLLTRLYDPTEGNVLLDDYDIRDLNVRQLRGLVGVVQQEPSLFDRSVFENIALGLVNSGLESHQSLQPLLLGPKLSAIAENVNPEAYEDPQIQELIRLVRRASNLAEVSTFIPKLENGYATMVGSGGQLVSGGQRQRIALARALIKDPKILVLDEATASLDSATEQRIQVAIERVAVNRTVISIAHRLSTIKGADCIIVMNGGEVVEQGTYDELVTLDGVFAGMASLQALPDRERSSAMSSRSSKASLDEKVEVVSVDAESSRTKEAPIPISSEAKPETETKQLRRRMLREVGRLLRPYLAWLALAVIAAVIVGSTFSGAGLIFGNAVGALGPCSNSPSRIRWAGMFFGGLFFMLAVVEFFANLASWSSFGIVAEKLVYRARVLSFRSLFEQGVEWHRSNGRSPSSLLSIITNDSVALNGFSGSIIGTIFGVVVNVLVAVILSHIIAWKIALVFLVTVPVLLGAGIMQLRALARFQERHADAFSKAIGISVEAVGQIKNVAVLGLENEVFATYTRALAAPRKDIVGASFYTNFWLAISNSTGFLIYAFAYWWGSKLIMKGEYTQTQFFIILIAILVSAQLWGQMFSLAPEISRAKNSTQRIVELTNMVSDKRLGDDEDDRKNNDIESAPESNSRPIRDQHKGASVAFSNVSFAYPSRPDRPVLEDINFRIQPGQFVGLVGPSGAGKSTIMGLAQQLYAPTTGSISFDGNYSLAGYKNDIAVVPQDSALFSGSIKFNVGLGSRQGSEATLEEIEEACKLANIHDVIISLPDGYETDCGPSAGRLSGGQRQRLAIARALVRRPRLLLLDESTSALDAESEAAVQEGLSRAVRERGVTILAITHRLHTVMRADVIIVVEGGRIVDTGTHSELVERCESYRQNATGQMLSKGAIE